MHVQHNLWTQNSDAASFGMFSQLFGALKEVSLCLQYENSFLHAGYIETISVVILVALSFLSHMVGVFFFLLLLIFFPKHYTCFFLKGEGLLITSPVCYYVTLIGGGR